MTRLQVFARRYVEAALEGSCDIDFDQEVKDYLLELVANDTANETAGAAQAADILPPWLQTVPDRLKALERDCPSKYWCESMSADLVALEERCPQSWRDLVDTTLASIEELVSSQTLKTLREDMYSLWQAAALDNDKTRSELMDHIAALQQRQETTESALRQQSALLERLAELLPVFADTPPLEAPTQGDMPDDLIVPTEAAKEARHAAAAERMRQMRAADTERKEQRKLLVLAHLETRVSDTIPNIARALQIPYGTLYSTVREMQEAGQLEARNGRFSTPVTTDTNVSVEPASVSSTEAAALAEPSPEVPEVPDATGEIPNCFPSAEESEKAEALIRSNLEGEVAFSRAEMVDQLCATFGWTQGTANRVYGRILSRVKAEREQQERTEIFAANLRRGK